MQDLLVVVDKAPDSGMLKAPGAMCRSPIDGSSFLLCDGAHLIEFDWAGGAQDRVAAKCCSAVAAHGDVVAVGFSYQGTKPKGLVHLYKYPGLKKLPGVFHSQGAG